VPGISQTELHCLPTLHKTAYHYGEKYLTSGEAYYSLSLLIVILCRKLMAPALEV